jgi:hypothetical protein
LPTGSTSELPLKKATDHASCRDKKTAVPSLVWQPTYKYKSLFPNQMMAEQEMIEERKRCQSNDGWWRNTGDIVTKSIIKDQGDGVGWLWEEQYSVYGWWAGWTRGAVLSIVLILTCMLWFKRRRD